MGLLNGLGRAPHEVPKPKSLNIKITTGVTKYPTSQQRVIKDPTAWLERIYQTYGQNTNLEPEALQNVYMVNMTFIQQSA
jgi:hypothetical protein